MSLFADVKDVDGLSAEALELERLRHTAAHVMAQAVRRFWPDTSLAIGPTVEGGFYYDMLIPEAITQEHLAKIETEMRKIDRWILSADQILERNSRIAHENFITSSEARFLQTVA